MADGFTAAERYAIAAAYQSALAPALVAAGLLDQGEAAQMSADWAEALGGLGYDNAIAIGEKLVWVLKAARRVEQREASKAERQELLKAARAEQRAVLKLMQGGAV